MRRIGDLNFDLESIVNFLCDKENMKSHQILNYVFLQLSNYPDNREEYEDGTFPKFKLKGSRKKIKSIYIAKKFNSLIKEYIEEHDLQWGELLYIVKGYLDIHRPSEELMTFSYCYEE